jgi:hypothetical protein
MPLTYTQLVDAVQDTIEQYDATFIASIPSFIRLAEEGIYNSVLLPALRRNATASMQQDFPYFGVPGDFLAVYSLAVIDDTGRYTFLTNVDVSYINSAYPNPTITGQPKHYALFDDTAFVLGPTPNAPYMAELHYYYYPPSIVDAGTSWLGENFESVLLYGTLVRAYIFQKGEADVLAMYSKQYDEALAQLQRLGRGLNRQDEFRSGFKKVQP